MKRFLLILILLHIPVLIQAQDTEPHDLSKVTLQLKWKHQFQFAGYYAAIEKGFYRDVGLDVTLIEGRPGVDFVEEVMSGRVDYGVEGPTLVKKFSNGTPLVVLASFFQHSAYCFITLKESSLDTPQSLVGKRVMIRKSASHELKAMLVNEGVDLKEITFVEHSWNYQDLVDGNVDAISSYITDQPFWFKQKNIDINIMRPLTYGIDFYGDCLFSSKQKMLEKPSEAKAFLHASIKGWDYAMTHPDEMINIIKRTYKSSSSDERLKYEYQTMLDKIILPKLIDLGHTNPGRWSHIIDIYQNLGLIGSRTSISDLLFDPTSDNKSDWIKEPWVRITLSIIGIFFLFSFSLLTILYYFNKRLQQEIKNQTVELAEKNEQFSAVFNNNFQLTGLLDIDANLTMVNTAALDLIGKTEADVLGKRYWETPWWEHSDEQKERLKAAIATALKGGFARFNATHIAADGDTHYIDFSIKPVKDDQGHVVSLIPEGRDITDKKMNEERYQTLFEQAGDAIVILKKGVVVDYNQKALELFDCNREWLIGANPGKFSPEGAKLTAWNLKGTEVKGSSLFKWIHKTAKGATFEGDVSLTALSFGNNEYMQAIIRDISAHKDLEQKLRQAQKMEAIGTLAGGIAHDFNNILAGLMGYNELALLYTTQNSKQEMFLKEMLKSIDRAKELVDQILTFSRHTKQQKHPVILAEIIKEAVKLLRASIPTTISLEQNLDSEASVLVDPTQLHQIIMNLCTNAYHAMQDEGGTLTINLTKVELDDHAFCSERKLSPGSYLKFEVSDTGSGMDHEIVEKVFEPYFTTKNMRKGTGLGLAVVHGIVTSNHGHIGVASELNIGTTFTIYLPETDAIQKASPDEQPISVLQGQGEHILFVDDEEMIVQLFKESLITGGYNVTTFMRPKSALEAFKQAPDSFDIMITDMTMPGMTGEKLSREILKLRPDFPIIMCSGYSEQMNKSKATEKGLGDYILKPVHIKTLLTSIHDLLADRAN